MRKIREPEFLRGLTPAEQRLRGFVRAGCIVVGASALSLAFGPNLLDLLKEPRLGNASTFQPCLKDDIRSNGRTGASIRTTAEASELLLHAANRYSEDQATTKQQKFAAMWRKANVFDLACIDRKDQTNPQQLYLTNDAKTMASSLLAEAPFNPEIDATAIAAVINPS